MKTETLKQTAFEHGLECVHDDGQLITFEDCFNGHWVAQIDKEKMFGIYLFPEFNDLPIETQENAYDFFYEYGKTPIRDRENKRFRLKHKYLQEKIDACDDSSNPVLKAFNVICSKKYKEKEIEELEYEYSELIKDFELIEVEE